MTTREHIEAASNVLQAARRLGAVVVGDHLRMSCGALVPLDGVPTSSPAAAYREILMRLLAGAGDHAGLDAVGRVALFQSLPQGKAYYRAGETSVSLDLQGISKTDAKTILNYLLNK